MGAFVRSKLFLVLALVLTIFFSGALGLKSPQDCAPPLTVSEMVYCFHEAAITMAYAGDQAAAVGACNSVFNTVPANDYGDVVTIAETERNICFADVAKIFAKDPNVDAIAICNLIPPASVGQLLQGSDTTRSICISKVTSLRSVTPAQRLSHPDSLCNIIFIFPFIAGLVIFRKGK